MIFQAPKDYIEQICEVHLWSCSMETYNKMAVLHFLFSMDKGFKGTVWNWVLSPLHGGLLEIKRTLPLNELKFKHLTYINTI